MRSLVVKKLGLRIGESPGGSGDVLVEGFGLKPSRFSRGGFFLKSMRE
jgi:hypothetical protein